MDNQTNWVVVGRFGRPYGIKGFVRVHSFTDPRDNILSYKDWHIFINKQWQPIQLLEIKPQIKGIIALVKGYAECDLVVALTNVDIAISHDQLAKLLPGEFYWQQLIGLNVINKTGDVFGKVTDVMPTGSNDVLVVEGEKRHLIPYLPGEFVLDISIEKQCIIVDWDLDF
ncbi:MAG: ribosome maturation factor RimM [Legionella sp.]|nr:ribosome maturation factor RimM [Legionella sp.]